MEPDAPSVTSTGAIKGMSSKSKKGKSRKGKGKGKGPARSKSFKGRPRMSNKGKGSYGGLGIVKAARAARRGGKRLGRPVSMSGLSSTVRRRLNTETKRINSSSNYSFSTTGSVLTIHGRQRIGYLASANANKKDLTGNAQTLGLVFDAASVGAPNADASFDTLIPFNPLMYFYYGVPLSNLVLSFQKFKFKQFSLEFCTQLPTTVTGFVRIAYFSDIDYPESIGYTGVKPLFVDQDLVVMSNCKTFPLYENFKYNVPITKAQTALRYFLRNEYTSGSNTSRFSFDNASDVADDRQSYQGMLAINGFTNTGDNAGTVLGDVYMTYSLELSEMGGNPSAAAQPPGVSRRHKLAKSLVSEFKNLELKETPPPVRVLDPPLLPVVPPVPFPEMKSVQSLIPQPPVVSTARLGPTIPLERYVLSQPTSRRGSEASYVECEEKSPPVDEDLKTS